MSSSPESLAARTLVVSPTLNEAENVEDHAKAVFAAVPGISLLIVDDDSPDRTWEVASALCSRYPNLHVLRRRENPGFARSYEDGFAWALDRSFERVVTMDADGSHPASALAPMIEASGEFDIVVGSRYRPGGGVSNWHPARRLLSLFANRYASFWTGLACTDLTGGFNCIRAELLRELGGLRSDGYAFQIELKFEASRRGSKIGEVPIVFSGRLHGESKLSRSKVLEGLWRPIRLRLGSVGSRSST
jgi:dolichol-phosphate mannosyltransferase